MDLLPTEFIKVCKAELLPLVTNVFNWIINNRNIPDIWSKGFRRLVFKLGTIINRNNYREYWRNAVNEIDEAYRYVKNLSDIWKMISRYTFTEQSHNVEQFYELFSDLARGCTVEYFNYEKCAIDFYTNTQFTKVKLPGNNDDESQFQIINNFIRNKISD